MAPRLAKPCDGGNSILALKRRYARASRSRNHRPWPGERARGAPPDPCRDAAGGPAPAASRGFCPEPARRARVEGLGRRAKYGLVHTDRGDTMIFHLGMSGRWRIDPEELGTHDHLVLETDEGRRLSLADPRRFGSVDLVATDMVEGWPAFLAMGPEPLGDGFDVDVLAAALAGRVAPIKAMLLDQRIVAGLGNIYVCEALNIARIAPTAAAGRIPAARLSRLVEAVRETL